MPMNARTIKPRKNEKIVWSAYRCRSFVASAAVASLAAEGDVSDQLFALDEPRFEGVRGLASPSVPLGRLGRLEREALEAPPGCLEGDRGALDARRHRDGVGVEDRLGEAIAARPPACAVVLGFPVLMRDVAGVGSGV